MENDSTELIRKQIVRTLDFNVLVQNMNTIYENFQKTHEVELFFYNLKGEYKISNSDSLEYGF